MKISKLSENIKLQELSVTKSEYGDINEEWTDFFTCHGSVKVISGRELYEARKTNSENQLKIELRYCRKLSHLNPQDYRIMWNGNPYRIMPPIENVDNALLRFNVICYETGDKNGE